MSVTTAPARAMRATAGEDAAVVARLKPGVIGRIRACDAGAAWCQVQVGEYRGWLRRDAFWGTDPGEAPPNHSNRVVFDEEAAGRYPYDQRYLPINRRLDGSVHDW